ncbi:FHA domain-containing protein [Mycobacterium sp. 050128]|uniref:FHA domain-containing protein n=1 Tax=Mycobacterium sp. 050128 TaxID=3096112 RepID=UPI002ED841D5
METARNTSQPPLAVEPIRAHPALVIKAENQTYTLSPREAPIVIGREFPAQVTISDDRISRTHLRIDHTPGGWIGADQSSNGTFINGIRQSTFAIREGMTIQLGHPQGITVAFGFAAANQAEPDDDDDGYDPEQTLVTDPGVARAGAAVAARREELKLTQRFMAREGIVNAGALIDFEKGRRWPRRATLARIEDALQWPHGTIERIRRGANIDDTERTEVLTNTVRAPLMAQAVEVALTTINSAITALPQDVTDPGFSARAATILADLRTLESVAANAAHTAKGAPEVALGLSSVRRCYKDLMLRAARAPGATLGQRLYAARYRAELTVEETAYAADVPVEAVAAAEAEVPLDANTAAALSGALAVLTRR